MRRGGARREREGGREKYGQESGREGRGGEENSYNYVHSITFGSILTRGHCQNCSAYEEAVIPEREVEHHGDKGG